MNNKCVLLFLVCITIGVLSCEGIDKDLIAYPFSQFWQTPPEYDDNGATKSLKAAAVSFDVDPSPEVNRVKIIEFIDKIKAEQPDVRLILFSETTLGYYYWPLDPSVYQRSIAETIPGVTTNVISQKAIEHQLYISFGMAERSGNDIYNSQVLIDPDGIILSVHHKYYLTSQDEESGYKAGQDITINTIDNIVVATIICHDLNSLEINKKIHESKAELVLHPVANVTLPWSNLIPFQYTNKWVLGTNRIGNEDGIEYDGLLFLTAPSGEHRIRTTGNEGYIYGVVKCK